jgi:hypothetical protein
MCSRFGVNARARENGRGECWGLRERVGIHEWISRVDGSLHRGRGTANDI